MTTITLGLASVGTLAATSLSVYLTGSFFLSLGSGLLALLSGYIIMRQLEKAKPGWKRVLTVSLSVSWVSIPFWLVTLRIVQLQPVQYMALGLTIAYGMVLGVAIESVQTLINQHSACPTRPFLPQERGGTLELAALFMLLVGLPLSIAAGDLTRYVYVRSVLQRSADAAAEAAAQQADIWFFQNTGTVRFNDAAAVDAARVAYANSSPLLAQGVYPSIDYIGLHEATDQAQVNLSARLRLFTIGAPDVAVRVVGTAELRMREQ
jgi:hypothetical protein